MHVFKDRMGSRLSAKTAITASSLISLITCHLFIINPLFKSGLFYQRRDIERNLIAIFQMANVIPLANSLMIAITVLDKER